MSELDEREIQEIIERVRRRVAAAGDAAGSRPGAGLRAEAELSAAAAADLGDGIHATIDEAVAAATRAFGAFQGQGLAGRKVIIDAVRRTMLDHAEQLARMAHQETHIGRYEDKIVKNRLVASKAPGPEDLEVQAVSGDAGMMVTEWAPFGVVAAITPVTNPTSTIINNTISIVSAGNAVVFNAHPGAKRCSAEAIRLINRAIVAAGGPADLVTGVANPDDRQRAGAHDPPRRPGPARHRRPGRRPRGPADRQAGDHRRPRQPAGRRRPDRRRRARRPGHRPRRLVRQQPRLHRREDGLRGRHRRRPADPGDDPERRLPAQGARAAAPRAGDLQGARPAGEARRASTPRGSARTPRRSWRRSACRPSRRPGC